MSQECPKIDPSNSGIPKNPIFSQKGFYTFALIMLRPIITDLYPDFSVRQKKIISSNSKMDIYKCPKMSKTQISWGL